METEQGRLEFTPVNVTLNRPDIEELDRMAREQQTNRSQLVRAAIQDFFAKNGRNSTRLRPVR